MVIFSELPGVSDYIFDVWGLRRNHADEAYRIYVHDHFVWRDIRRRPADVRGERA